MNERIKELAEQARIQYEQGGAKIQEPGQYYYEDVVSMFAELIVWECVAQCEQVAIDADAITKSNFVTDAGRMLHEGMWGGAKNCGVQIQTHFGVESELNYDNDND